MWRLWFRSLVPSWRFFDSGSAAFALAYRQADSAWEPYAQPRQLALRSLFFAPHHTADLLALSTVQRLVDECETLDATTIREGATYQVVRSLVRRRLPHVAPTTYQFKIHHPQHGDVFVSEIFSA